MPQTPRPGPDRRHLRIVLVAILLLTSGVTGALAGQATPAPDDGTRLYIGHAGGFVARIPADWDPDRSLDHDYTGRDGFVNTRSTLYPGTTYETPGSLCAVIAQGKEFDGQGEVTGVTWRGMEACEVRVSDEQQDDPVTLVFARPEPDPLGETIWVGVTVDAGHFDAVTGSISFDTSGVTNTMFLDSALDILETRSLWRDAVDWTSLREQAHARLGGFADMQTYWVAQSAINIVIDELHEVGADGHTYLVRAATVDVFLEEQGTYRPPTGAGLDHGIGYVSVPGFGGDEEAAARFIGEIDSIITAHAAEATCGWIVDLRDNTGGNMFPMIGGLAPLLPSGPLLEFRDVNGDEIAVTLEPSGMIELDGEAGNPPAVVPVDPYLSTQPVAVLTGPWTASAGEATTIAFADRDRTAFFGEPTADFATSPTWTRLLDGSYLAVSTDWMVGPQGAIYPDGIAPDVTVSPSDPIQPLADDPVVQEATDWLRQQPGCDLAA